MTRPTQGAVPSGAAGTNGGNLRFNQQKGQIMQYIIMSVILVNLIGFCGLVVAGPIIEHKTSK